MSKVHTRLLALVLPVIMPVLVHAQDAAEWPPDPETIFAPSVEVVGVKEIDPTNLKNISDGTAYINPDTRTVYIYDGDTQTWRTFPFPQDIPQHVEISRRRNDGILVISKQNFPPEPPTDPQTTWLLNPLTGEFFRPDVVCGRVKDISGEGQWVIVPREIQAPEYRLCFTETGATTSVLPNQEKGTYWTEMGTSPDQDWALLWQTNSRSLFSYHLPTSILTHLGELDYAPQGFSWVEWQDNTFFLMFISDMPEWSEHSFSIGDVTQPNSFHTVMGNVRVGPAYYDNPPRYEIIPGINGQEYGWRGGMLNGPSCILQIYYLETRQLEEFDLGELCTPNLFAPDNYYVRYFRSVSLDLSQPAVLARYDLHTRKRTDLLTGEIEDVVSISPDGRYVLLIMDDNGEINVVPDTIGIYLGSKDIGNTYWAIYDVEANKLVYQFVDDLIDLGSSDSRKITWHTPNVLSVSEFDESGKKIVYWVSLTTTQEMRFEGVKAQVLSPGGRYVAMSVENIQPETETRSCEINLFDLQAWEFSPITNSLNTDCNLLEVNWQNDGLLQVTFEVPDANKVQYTVHLPNE